MDYMKQIDEELRNFSWADFWTIPLRLIAWAFVIAFLCIVQTLVISVFGLDGWFVGRGMSIETVYFGTIGLWACVWCVGGVCIAGWWRRRSPA